MSGIEIAITWALLLLAGAALARRRLVARMLCGMAMTLMFMHCLYHWDIIGMTLSIITIPCLLANRRWFYEKLPNIW